MGTQGGNLQQSFYV